jgi:hypothetical protein
LDHDLAYRGLASGHLDVTGLYVLDVPAWMPHNLRFFHDQLDERTSTMGICQMLHRIFNATPPAHSKTASAARRVRYTKVQAYLDRRAAEPQPATGVAKYLAKLERDDFNRRHRLPAPTSVDRYLTAKREVARRRYQKGPTGVQKYLATLATSEAK